MRANETNWTIEPCRRGDGVHVTLEDVRREPLVTGLLRAGEARAMAADLAAAADATDAIAGEWARP